MEKLKFSKFINDEKEKLKNNIKENPKGYVMFLIVPYMLELLMLFSLAINFGTLYNIKLKTFLFVLLIMYAINIFFTFITGSQKRSVIIQGILIFLINSITTVKYYYTTEPFTFSDFSYIFNLNNIVGIVGDSFNNTILKFIPKFSIYVVILGILIYFVCKYNYIVKVTVKKRLITILVIFSFFIFLMFPPKLFRNFILEKIYYTKSVNKYVLNIQYYLQDTTLGGMYKLWLENKMYKPDKYDENEINEELSKSEKSQKYWEKSNIIVTFSESFFDVNLLKDDITFDKPVTSNFNTLKNKGIFINMISPTYGGISANTEFQLLTGFSLDYFSNSYVPFMSLYKSPRYANRISLIKELKNNDYYTKVVFGLDYFKSENVYKNLGIDEYEEKDLEDKYKGTYVSDEYLMDETIKALENKEKNKKIFYMNCTIQSHQSYNIEKYDKYDISISSSKLDEDLSNTILSYAQGAYDADKQLRKNV